MVIVANMLKNSQCFREEGQSCDTAKSLRSPAKLSSVSPNLVTIQYLPINITWAQFHRAAYQRILLSKYFR